MIFLFPRWDMLVSGRVTIRTDVHRQWCENFQHQFDTDIFSTWDPIVSHEIHEIMVRGACYPNGPVLRRQQTNQPNHGMSP